MSKKPGSGQSRSHQPKRRRQQPVGRTVALAMSIFKKKGTVESLFRIGAGDDEAGAKGAAAGAADDVNKHEVY